MLQELENEKEWRRFLMSEISEIKRQQEEIKKGQQDTLVTVTSLKVKLGAISMVFSGLTSVIYSYLSGSK